MLEKIRQLILRLFGINAAPTEDDPDGYVSKYEDVTGENITAVISTKPQFIHLELHVQ